MPNALLDPAPGTLPAAGKLERRVTLALVIGPFAAFAFAMVRLWSHGVSGLDVGLMVFMYFLTGFGVTVGYHRHFTHQSFSAHPALRAVMAVAASMAVQGSVIGWVADHRRHHAYSDREGDPHSPNLEGAEGFGGVLRGLWHAHTGWLFRGPEDRTDRSRWAPDLMKDRTLRRIDALFPVLAIASFILPGFIALALGGSFLTAVLWAGGVRVFFLHHVTWSINSICHFYGTRPFDSRDLSTNNWLLSIISMGESWHNNHHAFPTSAVHGLGRYQIDLTAAVIRTLERAKLVWGVKVPSEEQLQEKLRTGRYVS